ncbi:NAD(P)/FAD-dependent oxidoreductase [Pseudarthrobacter sp. NPDC058329]|uniref:NAD(P)/FAD-dependent oxidoreductase n=1 Tax=Pseudarthrobacter sp. NPDC058329 TaxID=3346448 RepID=UPI0036D9E179
MPCIGHPADRKAVKAKTPEHVVVVGASAAGLSAAEALRRGGYENKLTLIGAEPHLPYDRPPLSKQFLSGEWDQDKVMLRPPAHLADLDVMTRLGTPAVGLNTADRKVALATGDEVAYDHLVVATGVTPRMLPGTPKVRGVHTLRTLEDAQTLQTELESGTRVIVIGAGFLGTEIAAVAANAGVQVTLLSNASAPLAGALGPELGAEVAALHESHGVTIRTRQAAGCVITSDGSKVTGVALKNGEKLQAAVVVVAIGSAPAVRWLDNSGLEIGDGIECAPDSLAAPGIHAAGDVARWRNRLFNLRMRVEHRTNAVDQGIHVAEQILAGTRADYAPVPYFWSDQYDLKLQSYGWLRNHDEVLLTEGSIAEGKFVALFRRDNRVTGVVAARSVKALRRWRELIINKASWSDALDAL